MRAIAILLLLSASAGGDESLPDGAARGGSALFAVVGKTLVPLACTDGKQPLSRFACPRLVPAGASVRFPTGDTSSIAGPAGARCPGDGEVDPFPALRAAAAPTRVPWAAWPPDAAAAVRPVAAPIRLPTPDEKRAARSLPGWKRAEVPGAVDLGPVRLLFLVGRGRAAIALATARGALLLDERRGRVPPSPLATVRGFGADDALLVEGPGGVRLVELSPRPGRLLGGFTCD